MGHPQPNPNKNHGRVAAGLVAIVVAMGGLSYAAVPAYRLFCSVTGFGGTTQVADAPVGEVLKRTVRVRFTADTGPNMPWQFEPETREITLQIGASGFATYQAHNPTASAISGTAMYNVNPAKAGIYFNKVQCFCFDEQTLSPGQEVAMPVYFYIDPAMADDPNLTDVEVITLSYTFFRSKSDELDRAVDTYYQSIEQTETSGLPVSTGTTGG